MVTVHERVEDWPGTMEEEDAVNGLIEISPIAGGTATTSGVNVAVTVTLAFGMVILQVDEV